MSETEQQELTQPEAEVGANTQAPLESGPASDVDTEGTDAGEGRNINALLNVSLNVRVVLGHSRMQISELLELTKGSVIELDRKVGETVDVMINDRLVARGDLVKVDGGLIGVALREIVKDFIPTQ